jgi:hypothetical protein
VGNLKPFYFGGDTMTEKKTKPKKNSKPDGFHEPDAQVEKWNVFYKFERNLQKLSFLFQVLSINPDIQEELNTEAFNGIVQSLTDIYSELTLVHDFLHGDLVKEKAAYERLS